MVLEDIACAVVVFSLAAISAVCIMFAAPRDLARPSLYVRVPLGLTIGLHLF